MTLNLKKKSLETASMVTLRPRCVYFEEIES